MAFRLNSSVKQRCWGKFLRKISPHLQWIIKSFSVATAELLLLVLGYVATHNEDILAKRCASQTQTMAMPVIIAISVVFRYRSYRDHIIIRNLILENQPYGHIDN